MLKKLTFVMAGVAGLVVVTVTPTPAHHAFSAEFERPIHLEGTETRCTISCFKISSEILAFAI